MIENFKIYSYKIHQVKYMILKIQDLKDLFKDYYHLIYING